MISMKDAKLSTKIERKKPQPGEHVCEVVNLRELSGYKGVGFWLDLKVLEGPSSAGFEFSWGMYPDSQKPGGALSVEDRKARDRGKIQAAIAAVMGYLIGEAGVVDDAVYSECVMKTTKPGEEIARSPLAGRKLTVKVLSYAGSNGPTVYYEFFPISTEPKVDPAKLGSAATPPAPPAPPSAAPAGWTQHPENPRFYFNATGAVKTLEQIQAGA